MSRMDPAQIKELSAYPANSEERRRVEELIGSQYEILDEFTPDTQSQIIAIGLQSSM